MSPHDADENRPHKYFMSCLVSSITQVRLSHVGTKLNDCDCVQARLSVITVICAIFVPYLPPWGPHHSEGSAKTSDNGPYVSCLSRVPKQMRRSSVSFFSPSFRSRESAWAKTSRLFSNLCRVREKKKRKKEKTRERQGHASPAGELGGRRPGWLLCCLISRLMGSRFYAQTH